MGGYDYAFEFDPTKHRSLSKATRRIWDTSKGGAAPAITQEQAAFLALGLKKFSMDYRWMGNLTNSKINAAAGEVVIRLYRAWTEHLIYESPLPANGTEEWQAGRVRARLGDRQEHLLKRKINGGRNRSLPQNSTDSDAGIDIM